MALLERIQTDLVAAMRAKDEARLSAIRMIKTALKKHEVELADKEDAELKLIESYMPSAPSEEEIDAAISSALAETGATSAKQMGLVMKAAQAKLAGKRVDGRALSEKVKGKLV